MDYAALFQMTSVFNQSMARYVSLLTLQDVSFVTADGRTLFESVNFSVTAGRIGLVGRNGVGKSTLLRIMSGMLLPTHGSVTATGSIGVLRQNIGGGDAETLADLSRHGPVSIF